MNCCTDHGQCDRNANCPARGCSQSKGRDNVVNWINSVNTPPNYMPKVDAPPLGYSHDFLAMLAIWVIGVILGAVGLLYFLTWW